LSTPLKILLFIGWHYSKICPGECTHTCREPWRLWNYDSCLVLYTRQMSFTSYSCYKDMLSQCLKNTPLACY